MGFATFQEIGAWQRAYELKLQVQEIFNDRFTRIAKASEIELLNHFIEAADSGHISKEERTTLEHAARKAIKAANGLIRYLENNPDPTQGVKRQNTQAP